jgi:hypothetical protein
MVNVRILTWKFFPVDFSQIIPTKWSTIAINVLKVSELVCDNRELWPDRSTDEHPVWSKRCSIHPDTRLKKPHPKIQPSSPYFGGEMGRVWKNVEKGANVRNS